MIKSFKGALASPTFARGRFPKLRLVDVVAKAPSMDGAEKRALAAVCGARVEGLPEGSGRAPAFAAHLVDVIARYQLDAFFTRDPAAASTASTCARAALIATPMPWTPRQ